MSSAGGMEVPGLSSYRNTGVCQVGDRIPGCATALGIDRLCIRAMQNVHDLAGLLPGRHPLRSCRMELPSNPT